MLHFEKWKKETTTFTPLDFQRAAGQTVIVQLLWEPSDNVTQGRQNVMVIQMTPSFALCDGPGMTPPLKKHPVSHGIWTLNVYQGEFFAESCFSSFSWANSNSYPLLEMAQGLQ